MRHADRAARDMSWQVVPIERRHIAGVREVLDGLRAGISQHVAVDDERVVGWCDVVPKSHDTLRHSGTLGMGVAASHRGIGVGTALLRATLEGAVARGLSRIELVVRTDNVPAIELYRRHGFELEGRLRRYVIVDGAAYDALQMARLA